MNPRLQSFKNLSTLSYVILALPFFLFTCLMLVKIIPYLSFEHTVNFLSTKTDKTLDNLVFLSGFYVHIISSWFVLLAGLPQFLPGLVKQFPAIHRTLGKIYVLGILFLAAPSGLILASFANGGLPAQTGFTLQCFVWWFATFLAYKSIRAKNYHEHIKWMIRSYAITLAALSLRTEGYLLHYLFNTKPIETYITVTWLSWVGNLIIAEALIVFGLSKYLLQKFTKT